MNRIFFYGWFIFCFAWVGLAEVSGVVSEHGNFVNMTIFAIKSIPPIYDGAIIGLSLTMLVTRISVWYYKKYLKIEEVLTPEEAQRRSLEIYQKYGHEDTLGRIETLDAKGQQLEAWVKRPKRSISAGFKR